MFPTLARLSKASRRPLTSKKANKDFYKGTRQGALPGGPFTGAPGKHVVRGKGKYRLVDEQVRVFVAPPIDVIRNSPVRPPLTPPILIFNPPTASSNPTSRAPCSSATANCSRSPERQQACRSTGPRAWVLVDCRRNDISVFLRRIRKWSGRPSSRRWRCGERSAEGRLPGERRCERWAARTMRLLLFPRKCLR
ncbi:hypothetical protein BDZ89DRAFT_939534 [Hymenopellis radicata]|nr:hypothetical protein BDZ89DRAFT_939534 [Hymenopellis radicata]